MDLTNTSYVILGMVAKGARSGYDIKCSVDRSVRFFWTISYGQIYPELKRLTEMGMIEPEDASTGGRHRTYYRLTPTGEEALRDWLADPSILPQEYRDEMLLKLFFSIPLSREDVLAHVRAMRQRQQSILATLHSLKPDVAGLPPLIGPRLVLEGGVRLHAAFAEALEDWERRLTDQEVS